MTKILQIDREAAKKLEDALGFLTADEMPIAVQHLSEHREQATRELREALSDMVAMAVALGPDTWDISDLSDEGAVLKAARSTLTKANPDA